MSSRVLVALKTTGTSALKIVTILVVLKAIVDENINSYWWQCFGSSKKLHCHIPQLMGNIVSSRFLVALKAIGS